MTSTKTGTSGQRPSTAKRPPAAGEIEPQHMLESGWSRGMIGFVLSHEQFPIAELLQFGLGAERAGFDFVTASDHLQPWQDNQGHAGAAWVTLAALGQLTRRIGMGTSVTCPSLRYHPAVVAQTFASLSQLSPGRIFLGVGSGEALNEKAATGEWPGWQERSERLIEATELIRALWGGGQVQHRGRHYRVDARLYDPPAAQPPILMAANGPKAMRRAGQYGDGLITDPDTWQQHQGEFFDAARAAGREPKTLPVLAELFVVVGDERVARPAAERWRFLAKAFQGYHNETDPRAIRQRAEREVSLEQVFAQWTISAQPERHVERLVELFHDGISAVVVHSGQDDQRQVLEFYRSRVLPEVRKALGLPTAGFTIQPS
jgi:TAT-translocated FGD2 family F420-dependent dehydrogenase